MPVVVPVKFAFASRDLWFDPQGLDIVEADHAICSTERGTEIGLVTADPFEVPEDELSAPLKPVLRIATDDDLDYADELAQRGDDAMEDFRRLVKQNELDMKPVGIEYLFGGEKVVFYFAAEDRVDFRQLVKDLSSCFHTRIDMRQIGVRDETRLVGGYAHCGQELCCTRFGGQFEPVSIRMAKEQDLPLNSAKISGVCGRLMCCLRYEFEAYKDFKSRAPKKKTLIDTPLGKAKIQEYNTPREQLVLRLESGKVFRVNLSDMTCSEGCKKRAEEQGCSCRPDCVTRDILERIESPDIALALMELDREAGIDVGDGLSRADRLVPEAPARHRRQRSGEHGGEERSQRGQRGRGGDDRGQGAADEQVPHARRPRDRLPHAAAVAIFRARSATTLSAPRQLARRPLPHRRKTALPAAPAAVATRPLLSLDSRLASVRRASRRCLLWPIRWLRARLRLRVAVLAMAGEPVRQSMVRVPRLPTTRLRAAVRASRAEVRTAPTTLRLPSR
ncbi:PSP1 domain-containing protein [Collinsella bouchesdurhonensis]|uniref:PSP1 domain-containing protein n=1 Tax=Collinsella bouchesdurhonensis TaxID=1907654 RepID=UPI000A64EB5A|nr:regulatory iron-sulfur-containing complex subunit RicT [Collinsella bouchesdurhonensis]